MGVVHRVTAKCGRCGHSGDLTFWVTTQMWHCSCCIEGVRHATGYEDGYDANHPVNLKLHNQTAS